MWEEVARSAAADAGRPDTGRAARPDRRRLLPGLAVRRPCGPPGRAPGGQPEERPVLGHRWQRSPVPGQRSGRDIPAGDLDLALVVGAEALATTRRLKNESRAPAWSFAPSREAPLSLRRPLPPGRDRPQHLRGLADLRHVRQRPPRPPGRATGRVPADARRAAVTHVRGGRLQPVRLVSGRPLPRGDHRPHRSEPDGRLPVLQADDGHHGRGHGRRRPGGQRRHGRCPGRPRRSAGLPAGLGLARIRTPWLQRSDLWRSGGHGGGQRRRPGRRRRRGGRRRPPRSLLLLHQLHRRSPCDALGIEPRRPAVPADVAPTTGHRHRWPGLPRWAGEQLPHPCPGHHGRDPPGRPGIAGAGQRGRHAHEQARLRRLLDRARPAHPAGRRRRGPGGRRARGDRRGGLRGSGPGGHLLGGPRTGRRADLGRTGLRSA